MVCGWVKFIALPERQNMTLAAVAVGNLQVLQKQLLRDLTSEYSHLLNNGTLLLSYYIVAEPSVV